MCWHACRPAMLASLAWSITLRTALAACTVQAAHRTALRDVLMGYGGAGRAWLCRLQ